MTNAEGGMTNATAAAPRGLPGVLFIDEVCVDVGPPPKFEPFALEAESEVPLVPACVAVAKLPKTRSVVRRAMTADEEEMVKAIRRCVTFPTGHWDKRFMRDLLADEITDKQAVQVWRIFRRYRRQIPAGPGRLMTVERKEQLLRQAEVVVEAMEKPGGTVLT